MKQLLSLCVASIFVIACGKSSPTAPTAVVPPPVPACQTNRTGTVSLRNAGNRTVDMLWNGSVRGTVNPGQSLPEFTVPASGPQYVFDAIITNTSIRPCQTLLATPIQCQVNSYVTCTF